MEAEALFKYRFTVASEISKLTTALEMGNPFPIAPLPRGKALNGAEWELLSVDAQSLTDPAFKPRS